MQNRDFFNTDKTLESVTGIPIEIGNWKFQSKRAGGSNTAFQARMTILRKPHERILNAKPGANDEALVQQQQALLQKLLIQGSAEKLLLPEWEGITMADLSDGGDPKAPAPFSVENAITLFTRYPDAFNEYFTEASAMGNFRKQAVEEQAGNSAPA